MYSRILAPIDGSEVCDIGIAEALQLAARLDATIRFFNVIDMSYVPRAGEGAAYAEPLMKAAQKEADELMDRALERAEEAGVSMESGVAKILVGRPAEEIVREAERWRADLIVMGTHGRRGLSRAMLGSDAEWVLRHSPVPVLMVPPKVRE